MNIISEHGYRQDGRKPHQIRNLNYNLGVYSQADGSAYLEQGNTKVSWQFEALTCILKIYCDATIFIS